MLEYQQVLAIHVPGFLTGFFFWWWWGWWEDMWGVCYPNPVRSMAAKAHINVALKYINFSTTVYSFYVQQELSFSGESQG